MKGIIALDLDGVVVLNGQPPAPQVTRTLEQKVQEGWELIFITGRSLTWAKRILKAFRQPFALAPQNGALIVDAQGKILHRHYLDSSVYPLMDELAREEEMGYAIYLGDEEERVFWEPECYSEPLRHYLKRRYTHYQENWVATQERPEEAACIKWIGDKEPMARVASRLKSLHCPVLSDPYQNDFFIAQATHPSANKGKALKTFRAGKEGVVIAAGDDHNDRSLLMAADIKIAMEEAPLELKAHADIIAKNGIIQGLKDAGA